MIEKSLASSNSAVTITIGFFFLRIEKGIDAKALAPSFISSALGMYKPILLCGYKFAVLSLTLSIPT